MRALRLLLGFVFEVASAALVVGVPGAWVVRHMDLARLAATQASAALHRPVTIESLTFGLGGDIRLTLTGLAIANIEGGSAPAMVTLRRLSATVDARSLLHGPPLLRHVAADGFDVLLERTPDRTPNWRFGDRTPGAAPGAAPAEPAGRSGFPSLRDVVLGSGAVTYRTGSGHSLVTRLDRVGITTAADDQPVLMTIAGAYNGTPLTLDADLQSIAALRDAGRPFGTVLRFASGDMRLTFDGTMTDPLNVDGAEGTLDLQAPDPRPILKMAGSEAAPDVSLFLSGGFAHKGPAWRLDRGIGALQTSEVLAATLVFEEGAPGHPDRVEAEIAFDGLDLNEMLGTGARGKRSDADVPLAVVQSPDTLVKARVTAKTLDYAGVKATDLVLSGAVSEGRVAVDAFAMAAFGARLRAEGRITADGAGGGRITADVQASEADVQTLRRALGFGAIPVTGRLQAQATVEGSGRTLNAAVRAARASVVVAMRGGSVEKAIVEMASTDVRALFRTNKGMTPVACLLAGLDMRGGVGTLAPLRLRAAEGVISGSAQFDLYRRTFDLTIGSEARSTGFFALDIPVRASGTFASPVVRPAQWWAQGRAQLAAADNLSRLPQSLQTFARHYPCPRS